jgi:hypothetical protein
LIQAARSDLFFVQAPISIRQKAVHRFGYRLRGLTCFCPSSCFYQAKSRTSIPDTATFETGWPAGRLEMIPGRLKMIPRALKMIPRALKMIPRALKMLFVVKKPYTIPDTRTSETACGCLETRWRAKDRTPL